MNLTPKVTRKSPYSQLYGITGSRATCKKAGAGIPITTADVSPTAAMSVMFPGGKPVINVGVVTLYVRLLGHGKPSWPNAQSPSENRRPSAGQ